jgi:hypothetical protein
MFGYEGSCDSWQTGFFAEIANGLDFQDHEMPFAPIRAQAGAETITASSVIARANSLLSAMEPPIRLTMGKFVLLVSRHCTLKLYVFVASTMGQSLSRRQSRAGLSRAGLSRAGLRQAGLPGRRIGCAPTTTNYVVPNY